MKRTKIPHIQGRRFDIETLHHNAASLAKQADEGPTFVRHHGRIAYVLMSETHFDEVWPDPRRVRAVDEIPLHEEQRLIEAVQLSMDDIDVEDSE